MTLSDLIKDLQKLEESLGPKTPVNAANSRGDTGRVTGAHVDRGEVLIETTVDPAARCFVCGTNL